MKVGFLFCVLVCFCVVEGSVHFSSVKRNIDLTTTLARHDIEITVENKGSGDVGSVDFQIEENKVDNLSYLTAKINDDQLSVTKKDDSTYTIELKDSLGGDDVVDLNVHLVFTNTMAPFPASITQEESQLVVYEDNAFLYTPYKVDSQTTVITLASSVIESNTEVTPFNIEGQKITYGPYEDREALSNEPIRIHFENNAPFLSARTYQKDIEVSHWGNIAVEESFVIVHSGAKLDGPFNRLDYQRRKEAASTSVDQFTHYLPVQAADIYYRDSIGNISSSHVRKEADRVAMEMIPRFPLFGGWKTEFYMGYNLPLAGHLFKDTKSSQVVLKIDFAKEFDIDIPIENARFRVILPEGSSNIKVHVPFEAEEQEQTLHFTYLDTSGRPVVEVTKKNLVDFHNQIIHVTYDFSGMALLKEPLLITGSFFTIFALAMFLVRFSLTISPDNSAEERKDKALREQLRKLKKLTDTFAGLLKRLRNISNKKGAAIKTEQDSVNVKINEVYTALQAVRSAMEDVDDDIASQVDKIIRKSQETQGFLTQLAEIEINHKRGEIVGQVYSTLKAQRETNFTAAETELFFLVKDLTDEL